MQGKLNTFPEVQTSKRYWRKRGQKFQAVGRSRGGLTTKIHALVDALGNPLKLELTAGQNHDSVQGYEMLKEIDLTQKTVLADRAYDTNQIVQLLTEQSATIVIPSKKNRRIQRQWDKDIYKERHLVECFFNKMNRRLATRFDKLVCTFQAFLTLASIMRINKRGNPHLRMILFLIIQNIIKNQKHQANHCGLLLQKKYRTVLFTIYIH